MGPFSFSPYWRPSHHLSQMEDASAVTRGCSCKKQGYVKPSRTPTGKQVLRLYRLLWQIVEHHIKHFIVESPAVWKEGKMGGESSENGNIWTCLKSHPLQGPKMLTEPTPHSMEVPGQSFPETAWKFTLPVRACCKSPSHSHSAAAVPAPKAEGTGTTCSIAWRCSELNLSKERPSHAAATYCRHQELNRH